MSKLSEPVAKALQALLDNCKGDTAVVSRIITGNYSADNYTFHLISEIKLLRNVPYDSIVLALAQFIKGGISLTQDIGFGDHVKIEQNRHGVPNEMYFYKVIGSFQSNSYVDVPVQSPETETIDNHDLSQVVACIRCGVQEREVRNFRIEDVELVDRPKGYKATEQPSAAAAVEGILTEEELNNIELANDFVTLRPETIKEIIASHRHLLSANAELSFKTMKIPVLENDNKLLESCVSDLEGTVADLNEEICRMQDEISRLRGDNNHE